MPVPAIVVGLFGWLKTLKKSTLNRRLTFSVMAMNLNADASWNRSQGRGRYWFRQGFRLSLNTTRCTVPLLRGIQTLLVSQNDDTLVPAGAFGGSAVWP